MLTHSRTTSTNNRDKARWVTKLINIPALAIRRKMKWIASIMHTNRDLPSRDVHVKVKEWFQPWLFGLSWEQAHELSMDENDWDDHIEQCILDHALLNENILDDEEHEIPEA